MNASMIKMKEAQKIGGKLHLWLVAEKVMVVIQVC